MKVLKVPITSEESTVVIGKNWFVLRISPENVLKNLSSFTYVEYERKIVISARNIDDELQIQYYDLSYID